MDKPFGLRPMVAALICAATAALFPLIVNGEESGARWLPFSVAPEREWGGLVTGEYETRAIGSDDVTLQRYLFRLGTTPLPFLSLWGEGGVAALSLESGSSSLRGDFGAAFGVGATFAYLGGTNPRLIPFVTGRGTDFISRLGDDADLISGVNQSRRSRFEWREGSGFAGLGLRLGRGELYGGAGARYMWQEEQRSLRSHNTVDHYTYTYRSGVRAGVAAGCRYPLPHRLLLRAEAEVYDGMWRVGLGFGQWGMPKSERVGE